MTKPRANADEARIVRDPRLVVLPPEGEDEIAARPKTRGECANMVRPCPFFGCRHHLAIDVSTTGDVRVIGGSSLPDDPTDEQLEAFADEAVARVLSIGSCSLDFVDRNCDGETLEAIAIRLVVTRERIRQIERRALIAAKRGVRRSIAASAIAEFRKRSKSASRSSEDRDEIPANGVGR